MKLQHQTQFVPTRENVASLLSEYGLPLASYKLADSGIENCTIIVKAISGKYVLRIYRQYKKSDEDIQDELNFVVYLGKNGIPVATPIANLKSNFISYFEQNGYVWQAILMPYIQGTHPDQYTNELQANLATLQAKMHNLATLYEPGKASKPELVKLQETQFINMIQNREALDSQQKAFVKRAENYVVDLDNSLPRGLCHLDFDNGNILSVSNTVTAVLDFDDFMEAPYVMCLAYTLWDIAFDLGLDAMTTYVDAYNKGRPLTKREESFIKPIMLFRHYSIGCLDIATDQMSHPSFTKYLELEEKLLSS